MSDAPYTPQEHFRVGLIVGLNAALITLSNGQDELAREIADCTANRQWHEAVHLAQQGRVLNTVAGVVTNQREDVRAEDADSVYERAVKDLGAEFVEELYRVAHRE